jgi:hypothetical protein
MGLPGKKPFTKNCPFRRVFSLFRSSVDVGVDHGGPYNTLFVLHYGYKATNYNLLNLLDRIESRSIA